MLKHNENVDNKEKVKYDLYKILRMSVLLSQKEVDELTLSKFKEASLSIDKMLGKEYDEKLETMFYNTTTLEEEEKRLKSLVAFISDRIEKRKGLVDDYRSVTSKELTDLEYISKSSELDLYEKRLNTIREYLDNSKLIEVNEQDLEALKEQLVKEYDLKSENELKNVKIEDSLFNAFVNALYEMDLYSSLELTDIDKEIENLQKEIKETSEQKDTFTTAFENLKLSGITGDLEIEYASYVENSKRNYYYVKEKEIILKLYKLIEEKESEYSNLFSKRENVKELLHERILLRNELGIKEKDYLAKVYELLEEQEQEIESEKVNVDNINVLTERIKLKENRLDDLKKVLNKPEILSLLKEYSLIDTYEHEDILSEDESLDELSLEEEYETEEVADTLLEDLLPEEEPSEEVVEEETEEVALAEKTFENNQVKEIRTVPTMNFGLSRLKSISVMKRVADMLGVNAKKEEAVVSVPEVKQETKEVAKESVMPEQSEELFWTPAEFADMKSETESGEISEPQKEETKVTDIFVSEPQIFEAKMPEMKKEEDIFVAAPSNNEIIFPEPVMPEMGQKVLPENKDDKFMWPENMETFDINGIFPG